MASAEEMIAARRRIAALEDAIRRIEDADGGISYGKLEALSAALALVGTSEADD